MALLALFFAGCQPHDAEVQADYLMYFAAETSDNIARVRQDLDVLTCDYADIETDDYAYFDPGKKEKSEEDDILLGYDTGALNAELYTDSCYLNKLEQEQTWQREWQLTPLDCRDLAGVATASSADYPYDGYTPSEIRDERLPGARFYSDCGSYADVGDGNYEFTPYVPQFFSWLNYYSYYVNGDRLDSGDKIYREEAIITYEGDLQLTVHADTPFGDVRFGFVVDPKFQPKECVDDESTGGSKWAEIDGDWLDAWSSDYPQDDGYTVYYVNEGSSYQLDPYNFEDYWLFIQEWSAAYTFARFGDEQFYGHSTDYQDTLGLPLWVPGAGYDDYSNYPYYTSDGTYYYTYGQYGDLSCDASIRRVSNADDGDFCGTFSSYQDLLESVRLNMTRGGFVEAGDTGSDDLFPNYYFPDRREPINEELGLMGKAANFPLDLRVEDNSWRPTIELEQAREDYLAANGDTAGFDPRTVDYKAEGLDGWVGINPSYVRFKQGVDLTTLKPGKLDKPLEGDFQFYYEALDNSASKLLIRGTFKINKLEEDVWGPDETMMETTQARNDTPECGE
jgi:hypothetical protein